MVPDAIDRLRRLQEDTAFLNKILTDALLAAAEKPAAPALPWVVRRKRNGEAIAAFANDSAAIAHADQLVIPEDWEVVEVAPAAPAPAIVPVEFDEDGVAYGAGWRAASGARWVNAEIDLRPGEDAGDITARMLAAAGRSA